MLLADLKGALSKFRCDQIRTVILQFLRARGVLARCREKIKVISDRRRYTIDLDRCRLVPISKNYKSAAFPSIVEEALRYLLEI